MNKPEEALLRAIADSPYDAAPRLVYADWLEECGDPRAEEVRDGCRYRMPITPRETKHLKAIAAGRVAANASQVVVAVAPEKPGYVLYQGPAGQAALLDDLGHLSSAGIARNFPRDDGGRLQLNCVVALAQYRCLDALPRGRLLWLAAIGPARRSDPQVITVKLEPLIGENQTHNWSEVRWWWDRRRESLDEQARWSITGAALRAVTGPGRSQRVAALWANWQAGTATPPERIALCTALQDDGRFEDALRVCGVEYPEEVTRLLNGEQFLFSGGWVEHPTAAQLTARSVKLRRALWEAAPWHFAQGLAALQARYAAWAKEKRGRSASVPALRLFVFPGAPHAQKPGLMLRSGPAGQPRLSVLFSGSNVVLPETIWKRPVELDIARWYEADADGARRASRGEQTRS